MRARRQLGYSLLLATVSLAVPGATAATAPLGQATISSTAASHAIGRAQRLLDGRRQSSRPAELTITLLRLARALPSLDPAQRRRAEALLARPTDSPDFGGNTYGVPEEPPYCTVHFCIHWVAVTADAPSLDDADGNGTPDYVETVGATAEADFSVENSGLGWQAALPDGDRGGDPRTDIYIVQLGGQVFGYSTLDPGQGSARSQFGYLVLDNDYSTAEFPISSPLSALQVTLAHEYNHLLQFGYDVAQDIWLYESTAVWMEDQVYPDNNDYLRYIGRWATRSKVPLTLESVKIYGSAVWNQWLAGRYGAAIVRGAWERTRGSKPAGFSANAVNGAIRAAGGSDLPREFARFAAATAEWRTTGVFPYPDAPLYPDLKRRGKLHMGQFINRKISHLGYLLLRVRPRPVKALRLLAGATRGTKSAFGLVCREGSVATGSVRIRMRFTKRGGIRAVGLRKPGRCSRITAVLVNADPRQAGFAFDDWIYRHEHERFAATLLARR